jgi:hypothetical protein
MPWTIFRYDLTHDGQASYHRFANSRLKVAHDAEVLKIFPCFDFHIAVRKGYPSMITDTATTLLWVVQLTRCRMWLLFENAWDNYEFDIDPNVSRCESSENLFE